MSSTQRVRAPAALEGSAMATLVSAGAWAAVTAKGLEESVVTSELVLALIVLPAPAGGFLMPSIVILKAVLAGIDWSKFSVQRIVSVPVPKQPPRSGPAPTVMWLSQRSLMTAPAGSVRSMKLPAW